MITTLEFLKVIFLAYLLAGLLVSYFAVDEDDNLLIVILFWPIYTLYKAFKSK